MDIIKEEDRIRRLQILEKKMRDPRNVSNVDSLLVRIWYFNFIPVENILFIFS